MALKATIYKAHLNLANMDEHVYTDYQLTLARHPSETDERLMVRLMAYARYASDGLQFTKDLFETNEPALWEHDLTGQLTRWIEVGLPDEDKVKKASARCDHVVVVAYGSTARDWYAKASKIKTLRNVSVWLLPTDSTAALTALCERNMDVQLNIMDGEWTLIADTAQAVVDWQALQ